MALEKLIPEIAAAIVEVPEDPARLRIEAGNSAGARIKDTFDHLLALFELDYLALWEFSGPQAQIALLHVHKTPDAPIAPRVADARHFGWAVQKLQRGEPVIESVRDLPKTARAVRKYFAEHGIRSWVALPLRNQGRAFGALVFVSTRRDEWDSQLIEWLQTITDIFATALSRGEAERALREKEALESSVLASLPANVAVLDTQGSVLHVNQRWSDFAVRNGAPFHCRVGVGDNYVDVCQDAVINREPQAQELRDGVVAVLNGATEALAMQYTCHLGARRSWFQLNVTSIPRPPGGAVITHTDITAQKAAERTALELPGRLLRAHEEERSLIARELHDHINQRLAMMTINLEQFEQQLRNRSVEQSHIEKLRKEAVQISIDVHRLSHRLHPSHLEHLGLAAAIEEQCREFTEQHQLPVECVVRDAVPEVDNEVGGCIFRILEEALHNAAKHSGATKVTVELSVNDGRLCLRVADNGKGIDPAKRTRSRGLGLISMRERLRLVRGELSISSSPSHGTLVEVRVPLRHSEGQQLQAA